jgi:hypothetical protein
MKLTKNQQAAIDGLKQEGLDIRIVESEDACGRWVCLAFSKNEGLITAGDWGYSNLINLFKHIGKHYIHLKNEGDVFYVFRTYSSSTEWMRQVFDMAFGL